VYSLEALLQEPKDVDINPDWKYELWLMQKIGFDFSCLVDLAVTGQVQFSSRSFGGS